jgi:glycosyltransferase involved in cell wall biosynthesis
MAPDAGRSERARRLLLVSQRPIDYGGGGSVRWRYLTEALPELGWHVTTVTSHPNPTANEASTDPRLARLAALRARAMNGAGDVSRPLFRRAGVQPEAFAPNLAWSVTGRAAIRRALARESPDVVWATSPPQSAILAAVPLARRAGVPVVAELRDLWAGNPFFDAGGTLLAAIEAPVLRQANAIVTVTPTCRDTLLRLHPEVSHEIRLLPNGFDPALLELRDGREAATHAPDSMERRSRLIHAGALYGDRSAAHLVRALSRPQLRARVALELLGTVDPATKQAILAAPSELEVSLNPPVSWREAVQRVLDADVSVVINSAGTGGFMAMPSKLYEALALGRPVLALTPAQSDTDTFLRGLNQESGLALPDDEDSIAAAALRLLHRPPPAVAPERLADFDRSRVATRIAALLDEVARGNPG